MLTAMSLASAQSSNKSLPELNEGSGRRLLKDEKINHEQDLETKTLKLHQYR
jgi:hypothetical protein